MSKEIAAGAAYRRHIVVDNINKVIFIEVQMALNGNLKEKEYYDITNGRWPEYVPINVKAQLVEVVANGYRVQPMVNMGAMNEQYYLIQISEIRKNVIIKP